MHKIIFTVLSISIALAITTFTGCSSKNQDSVPDKQPEELYMQAYESLAEENYSSAKDYLEAIDSRYPFGPFAHQVQLDLIYTYYKDRDNDLAIAEIDRFIRLNPTDDNIDWVLYIRGLTNMQATTDRVLDLIHIDRFDRDISQMETAFKDFKTVVESYPNSMYAADARSRMVHIKNMISKHELAIANFYYKKEAYISSARRCQKILTDYKDTEQLEDALKLLADDYHALKLTAMENNVRDMIKLNFN